MAGRFDRGLTFAKLVRVRNLGKMLLDQLVGLVDEAARYAAGEWFSYKSQAGTRSRGSISHTHSSSRSFN